MRPGECVSNAWHNGHSAQRAARRTQHITHDANTHALHNIARCRTFSRITTRINHRPPARPLQSRSIVLCSPSLAFAFPFFPLLHSPTLFSPWLRFLHFLSAPALSRLLFALRLRTCTRSGHNPHKSVPYIDTYPAHTAEIHITDTAHNA